MKGIEKAHVKPTKNPPYPGRKKLKNKSHVVGGGGGIEKKTEGSARVGSPK